MIAVVPVPFALWRRNAPPWSFKIWVTIRRLPDTTAEATVQGGELHLRRRAQGEVHSARAGVP